MTAKCPFRLSKFKTTMSFTGVWHPDTCILTDG